MARTVVENGLVVSLKIELKIILIIIKKFLIMSAAVTPPLVSNRLKLFMKNISATGKEMAKSAGITEQAFSGYMQGKNLPAALVLAEWANSLDLNINWLLTGEGDMFIRAGETGHSTQMALNEKDRLIAELLLENRELRKQLEKK